MATNINVNQDSVKFSGAETKNQQNTKGTIYTAVPKDPENGWGQVGGLEDKRIRQAFIRKVYFILLIQLLVTFGIIAVFHLTPGVREFVRGPHGTIIYFSAYLVFLITYFTIVCCRNVARKFPMNMIFLGTLTLAMSYMAGVITAYYKIESVLVAVGITALVCLGVSLFSIQTKYDFTSCAGVLLVLSLVVFGFGIACIFTYSKILYTVYSALGALIFSLFLAYDTQAIIGGRKYEINAEDHVFGALMLYVDIVNIFLHLLGLSRN